MAVAHVTPFTDLFELAFPIPELKLQWYSADDTVLHRQQANARMLAEIFGKLNVGLHPELYNNVKVLRSCAEEYEQWFAEYQACRRRNAGTTPVITDKVIAEVTDLVEQLSNLQLCYNVIVGECRQMCERLCPDALAAFDERFESGA